MKAWAVILMAAGIWLVGLIDGMISGKFLFGLLLYAVIGVIFPPLGIGFGIIILLVLLMTKGTKVFSWFNSKLGGTTSGKNS